MSMCRVRSTRYMQFFLRALPSDGPLLGVFARAAATGAGTLQMRHLSLSRRGVTDPERDGELFTSMVKPQKM